MEDIRAIKFLILTLGGALMVVPLFVFAYDDKTTHPALTQEIVSFYNLNFSENTILDNETEWIVQGSIDEDKDGRWMHHFYDPVYNRGLFLENEAFPDNKELAVVASGARSEWLSAKEWGQHTHNQARSINNLTAGILKDYYSSNEDFSWERAIYEYAWGDKERGLTSLGHILHLLEDMTVPDHTRNDPHPPVLDMGSPYEAWTKKFNRNNIRTATGKDAPVVLENINEYFDKLASYTNNNFFSKDSIFHKRYTAPIEIGKKTITLSDGIHRKFITGVDTHRNKFLLAREERLFGETKPAYSIRDSDNLILSDYWTLLSKQAVLHGAGAVKLFFDEVEKEKQNKTLYAKNRSFAAKQVDKFRRGMFNVAGALYGISVRLTDLEGEEDIASEEPSKNQELSKKQNPPPPNPPTITPKPTNQEPQQTPNQLSTTPKVATLITAVEERTKPIVSQNPVRETGVTVNQASPVQAENSTVTSNAGGGGRSASHSPMPPENSASAETIETPTPPPPPPPPTSPPPDTTGPNANLTIAECETSLSSDGCLILSPNLSISWSSAADDLTYFEISCDTSGSPCTGFTNSTTTATSTNYTLPDQGKYSIKVRAFDLIGNAGPQMTKSLTYNSRPLVINEIAWAGTSAARDEDEWLEIFNPTDLPIILNNWILRSKTDNSPYISLAGTIAPNGFFLLERTDNTTISDLSADQIYTGALSNNGEVLELSYASTTIDETPPIGPCGVWCGGGHYFTAERVDPEVAGTTTTNWRNWEAFLQRGKNADNLPINGTPRLRNSVNHLITQTGNINTDTVLKKSKSPYIVPGSFGVLVGKTLAIEPGVVIKFYNESSGLAVSGKMLSLGTESEPVVFTSLKDDSHGGDTNADGVASAPAPANWTHLHLIGDGSELNHTIIRYGGNWDYAASVEVGDVSITIRDSTIEKSGRHGILLKNASGLITRSKIRENSASGSSQSTGIVAEDGNLTIEKNVIEKNYAGLTLLAKGGPHNLKVRENDFRKNTEFAIRMSGLSAEVSDNTASLNGINGILFTSPSNQNYTLYANLPYGTSSGMGVGAGKTLTINKGAVLKFGQDSGLKVNGMLKALGTADQKIVFTSIRDDEYGGDTNNDGSLTSPAAGNWDNIKFEDTVSDSELEHVVIRYGGTFSPWTPTIGAIYSVNSSFALRSSVVENNYRAGIYLENATSTSIVGTIIRNHQLPAGATSAGIHSKGASNFLLQNALLQNNQTGIKAEGIPVIQNNGGNIFEGNIINTDPASLLP